MNNQFEVRLVYCGGLFIRADGSVMMRLANPESPLLSITTDYKVWAADTKNGVIYKLDPWELVRSYYV